jgi:ABC-2 type transport system permease protein
MHKILLILKREYLTRVRKRTFILSTILFPLLYLGLIFGTAYIGEKGKSRLRVAITDSSGYFDKGRIERENQKDSSSLLTLVNENPDSLKTNFKKWGYDGFILIPPTSWENGIKGSLQTDKTLSIESAIPVQNKLNNIWNGIKNEKLGISDSIKAIIETSKITIIPKNINDEKADSSVASGIGFTAGILIYIILVLYGSQVMTGVMEEKTNRIAEVIISSVKPFQLMVGKIIGIGLVALTQFLLWITFIFIIYNVTKASGQGNSSIGNVLGGIQSVFTSINIPLIIFCFIFYLLAGFFFYASLYAAIGSAVNEDMREAQSLSFPVTILVIFSFAIMSAAMKDPTGPLAVWGSIIPFSSPIVMMARIAFGVPTTVPWWQLGLSMITLIAGFILTAWFAGRIYRTGILMYGKKPSWKELLKWAFRKS